MSPVSPSAATVALCGVNVALFFLIRLAVSLKWRIPTLSLVHAHLKWWQFITSAFSHASWEHLSSNLFMLYVFGKLVEEEEGALGVWATYLICSLGGNLAALWTYPSSTVSLGASAAVFGLFVVSVMIRLSWNVKKLLEVVILGQFVVKQVVNEVNLQMQRGSFSAVGEVGHMAHLGGALMGVMLILLLRHLPDPTEKTGP